MIHKAKDLSPGQKDLIESLVGRPVMEDESVSVCTFEAPKVSDERQEEIANELRRYFAEVDASRQPISPDEAGEIITAAIRSTRPGYRPHK